MHIALIILAVAFIAGYLEFRMHKSAVLAEFAKLKTDISSEIKELDKL
jgi:hypothetical protein